MEAVARNLDGFDRARRWAGMAALPLVLVCALLGGIWPGESARSYLIAFIFWFGLAGGALGLMMMHHLTGGDWGRRIHPVLRSASSTLPLMAVLFVPVLLAMPLLYPWAKGVDGSAEAMLAFKKRYLTGEGFLVRSLVFFASWLAIWGLLIVFDRRRVRAGEARSTRSLRAVSAVGLVVFGFTMSFAAIDWIMTLQPDWASSIFGLSFMVGEALLALAFAVIVSTRYPVHRPDAESSSDRTIQTDLGNLLLAFVMLWAYMSFSQYLIIWSANLPEEISYYVRRTATGWRIVAWTLMLGHFAAPVLLLMTRWSKEQASRLIGVALFICLMRLVDVIWLVEPAFHRSAVAALLLDLAMFTGIGCLWAFWFMTSIRRTLTVAFAPGPDQRNVVATDSKSSNEGKGA